MSDGRIVTSRDDVAGVLMWDRPEKRNALTYSMWAAIPHALAELVQAPGLRYVIVRGAAEHFSAGADLAEVHAATGNMADARRFCRAITRALYAIATCPLPTVAAVRGQAIGGALELALAADFRLAADNAQLQFPFVVLGMVPDPLTLKRLVALVGDARARHLLFMAEMLPVATCRDMGLVDEVVPDAALDAAVAARMAAYRQSSAYVLERSKPLLTGLEGPDLEAVAEYRAQSFVYGGVREAAAKFLARR